MTRPANIPEVFDALQAEQEALQKLLEALDADAWSTESRCPGWTVLDVVLHLAQTEELVAASITGRDTRGSFVTEGESADDAAARWVAADRGGSPGEVLERWRVARGDALAALRSADSDAALPWMVLPLKPRTLATTRLSEHWIHALDVADPLSMDYPDTDRLWHLAWLAHRTLPYAFGRAGLGAPPAVRLELTSPSDDAWVFGDDEASSRISGRAGEFCRIAARRLSPAQTGSVRASGPQTSEILEHVRLYA